MSRPLQIRVQRKMRAQLKLSDLQECRKLCLKCRYRTWILYNRTKVTSSCRHSSLRTTYSKTQQMQRAILWVSNKTYHKRRSFYNQLNTTYLIETSTGTCFHTISFQRITHTNTLALTQYYRRSMIIHSGRIIGMTIIEEQKYYNEIRLTTYK